MGPSLIDIAPSFHQAVTKWPEANNLKQHYEDLVLTYESNGSSLVELTRSFFESVCWTIIEELGAEKPSGTAPSTTEIFSLVKKALNIDYSREAIGLSDILSGFNKVTKGLIKLRDHGGSVAHGKDGFAESISIKHIKTQLLAADALVSLLLNVFEGSEPNLLTTREPYIRFEHLSNLIDQNVRISSEINLETGMLEIKVNTGEDLLGEFQMNVKPSEFLFELNRQAYKDIVQALHSADVSTQPLESEEEVEPAEEVVIPESIEEIIPSVTLETSYEGKLGTIFNDFIVELGRKNSDLDEPVRQSLSAAILNGLEPYLVIDWKDRDVVKSQIRLVIKKVIREMNIDLSVESIFDWLIINLPDQI